MALAIVKFPAHPPAHTGRPPLPLTSGRERVRAQQVRRQSRPRGPVSLGIRESGPLPLGIRESRTRALAVQERMKKAAADSFVKLGSGTAVDHRNDIDERSAESPANRYLVPSDRFYQQHVPVADKLYDEHLEELRQEGLIT